jgi:hypothetical protein
MAIAWLAWSVVGAA